MATLYKYDGTIDGLFTTIAYAIKQNQPPQDIVAADSYQGLLFADEFYVASDDGQVARFWEYLNNELTAHSVHRILTATLNGIDHTEMVIYDYVKLSLKLRKKLDLYHAHPIVEAMHQCTDKVIKELHLFKGILRFQNLKDDILYAPFQPDHRIAYPLAEHFQKRLAAEKWIIHDINHQSAVYWDGNELLNIDLDQEFLQAVSPDGKICEQWLAADEKEFQHLWQTFYQSIAIKARENLSLRKQFMPKRYWPYLVELKG